MENTFHQKSEHLYWIQAKLSFIQTIFPFPLEICNLFLYPIYYQIYQYLKEDYKKQTCILNVTWHWVRQTLASELFQVVIPSESHRSRCCGINADTGKRLSYYLNKNKITNICVNTFSSMEVGQRYPKLIKDTVRNTLLQNHWAQQAFTSFPKTQPYSSSAQWRYTYQITWKLEKAHYKH
jgi:hypothetical protein